MRVRYNLAGKYVNPVKSDGFSIEVNHDQQSIINQGRPHVGASNLFFAREDIATALSNLKQSPGITEGIPLNIEIDERGVTEVIQMYVDCMDAGFKMSKDGMNVGLKMLQSIDWLENKVDGFTFESMYNESGVASFVIDGVTYSSYKQFMDAKCIYVPYVISTIPNWNDAFLALFGMTYICTELYKVGKQIQQWATPTPGVPAVTVSIPQLIIEIAFAVLLIATLISLINQLIQCLIQPVKYHGAMLMSDLLKVVSVKLGLKEKSSIWDNYPFNQVAYLPEKYQPFKENPSVLNLMGFNVDGWGTQGYTSPNSAQRGYYNGIGGDFLRLAKQLVNGKFIIPDQTNTLQLERRDYFPNSPTYQLPDVRSDWNGFNTDELDATIIIKFINDNNEQNVANNRYEGTELQATHQQITTVNQALVLLKGLREINLPVARGANKTSLTFIEKVVGDLERVWGLIEVPFIVIIDILIIALDAIILTINLIISIWNAIIDVLHEITNVVNDIIDAVNTLPGVNIPDITAFDNGKGKITPLSLVSLINPFKGLNSNNFTDRINALLLENDIVDVPKLLLIDTSRSEFKSSRIGYLHPDNPTTINAKYLWDNFYYIDQFPLNAQTKISPSLNAPDEKNKVMLSLKDFKSLVSNPQFKDFFGDKVIADSIIWYPEQNGAADISYRKPKWLVDPFNKDGAKRSQTIFNNLTIKISLPNGQ